eukprot:GHVN01078948.1.p1 GENE.GHVN01078948.1~~GHVN01078948.1.p1  ORF type:complete len:114 (-),score=25.68 GHVN01078948.1:198-539(-)
MSEVSGLSGSARVWSVNEEQLSITDSTKHVSYLFERLCNAMCINIFNAQPVDLPEPTLSHMPEHLEERLCNTMCINIFNAQPVDLPEPTLSHMPEHLEGHDVRVFSVNQRKSD